MDSQSRLRLSMPVLHYLVLFSINSQGGGKVQPTVPTLPPGYAPVLAHVELSAVMEAYQSATSCEPLLQEDGLRFNIQANKLEH